MVRRTANFIDEIDDAVHEALHDVRVNPWRRPSRASSELNFDLRAMLVEPTGQDGKDVVEQTLVAVIVLDQREQPRALRPRCVSGAAVGLVLCHYASNHRFTRHSANPGNP